MKQEIKTKDTTSKKRLLIPVALFLLALGGCLIYLKTRPISLDARDYKSRQTIYVSPAFNTGGDGSCPANQYNSSGQIIYPCVDDNDINQLSVVPPDMLPSPISDILEAIADVHTETNGREHQFYGKKVDIIVIDKVYSVKNFTP